MYASRIFEGKLRTARNKDPAFVIDGYCNWKKALERFREHQTSACHLLAIDSIVTLPKTCADIGSSLSDKKEVAKNRQIISRNGPYIGGHLAFFFKLNFKPVYNVL